MISSKRDYKYYIECDRVALGKNGRNPNPFTDEIWYYQRVLRLAEYVNNTSTGFLGRIKKKIINYYLHKLEIKLGYTIPINVFGPGLAIVHRGTIVVSRGAKIGANCRIHEGVTIGATNGSSKAAKVGDNVFIATGVKIIGDVIISDNVAIAANAVVVHDVICEKGCTVGGIPAKIISNNTSILNLKPSTDIVDKYF